MTGDKPGNEAAYTSVARIEERTGNRQPRLQPAAYVAESGFTTVPLHLAERESVFVIFKRRRACSLPYRPCCHRDNPRDPQRLMDSQFPSPLGRTVKHHSAEADLLNGQHKSRCKVFLRYRRLYDDDSGISDMVSPRPAYLARSRQSLRHRRTEDKRNAGRRHLGAAVPDRSHRESPSRRQQD